MHNALTLGNDPAFWIGAAFGVVACAVACYLDAHARRVRDIRLTLDHERYTVGHP